MAHATGLNGTNGRQSPDAARKRNPKRAAASRAPAAKRDAKGPKMAGVVPDRAWFEQRMKSLGVTQKAVGEAIGVRKEGIGRILAGSRDVSAGEAAALAKALRCSVGEIMHRIGLDVARGLALSGRVLSDGRVSSVIDNTAGTAAVVGEYPTDAVALLIEAPAGALAPYDGAVLVYRPSSARAVGPEVVGRLCVLEDAASPLPIVGELLPATGSRENRIRVFGSGEEVAAKRLVKAHTVLAIHMRA